MRLLRRDLLGQAVEIKGAAAKIERATFFRDVVPRPLDDVILPARSVRPYFENSSGSQYAKVLGDIVLRDFQRFRKVIDAPWLFQERLNDSDARLIRKCLENIAAVSFRHTPDQ